MIFFVRGKGMIRLEIVDGENHANRLFDLDEISIGPGRDKACDIGLENDRLQSPHVKFLADDGGYLAINVANDPYVTLNQLPFGKRTLKAGDRIAIHDTEIRIMEIGASLEKEDEVEEKAEPTVSEPIKDEPEEPVEEPEQEKREAAPLHPTDNQRSLRMAPLLILPLAAVLALFFYLGAEEINEEEEKAAARSVADAAAAYIYADLNGLPQQTTADSIEDMIGELLPKGTRSTCFTNSKGELYSCPYTLRTYRDPESGYLLVIAQPRWDWTQWFSPKEAIVLDSSYALRKVQDIRPVNQLLHKAGRFDLSLREALQPLVYRGELIPLEEIDEKGERFTPPAALGKQAIGAEHSIFNAPRYKHLSEKLLKLATSQASHGLEDALQAYRKYPQFLIYHENGKKEAEKIHSSLKSLGVEEPILIAYSSGPSEYTLLSTQEKEPPLLSNERNEEKRKQQEALSREIYQLLLQNIDLPNPHLRMDILSRFRKYELIDQERLNNRPPQAAAKSPDLSYKPLIE